MSFHLRSVRGSKRETKKGEERPSKSRAGPWKLGEGRYLTESLRSQTKSERTGDRSQSSRCSIRTDPMIDLIIVDTASSVPTLLWPTTAGHVWASHSAQSVDSPQTRGSVHVSQREKLGPRLSYSTCLLSHPTHSQHIAKYDVDQSPGVNHQPKFPTDPR